MDTSATNLRKKPLSDSLAVGRSTEAPLNDWLMIAIFIGTIYGLLFSTLLNMVTSRSTESREEKRNLAAMPHLRLNTSSLKAFPAGFEAFLNDRFAFRKNLIAGASYIKYAFGVSGSREVLIGKRDWLYYTDSSDMATLRHSPLFAPEEVSEWARVLEARRIWLNQRGIKFLVVIVPSKFTVYPEYVPQEYTSINKTSRREQLIEVLKTKTKVPFLDLLDTLLTARSRGQLYYRTDTHWNVLSGAIATNKIVATLKPWLRSLHETDINSFQRVPHLFVNGDLADLLGLHGVLTETETLFAMRPRWHYSDHPKRASGDRFDEQPFAMDVDDPELPRVVFLRDSFLAMPKLFLGDHFRRALYRWTQNFPTDVILSEKPDVVVEEFVERKLVGEMPKNPADVDALMSPTKFAAQSHNNPAL